MGDRQHEQSQLSQGSLSVTQQQALKITTALSEPANTDSFTPSGPNQQVQEIMQAFWQQQIHDIETGPLDFKFHQLPLARVKKVMKTDEDVKMISAEAPMLFSKACEIFILELTMRAWIHTEEHKRRTLQKSDVATAVSKADMYDFPREDVNKPLPTSTKSHPYGSPTGASQPASVDRNSAFEPYPQTDEYSRSNEDMGP
ncbi:histone-fold-containing protein [Gaertneriomyces semiglobifer]|nr:histone-fold-containing protein [Gaertneriomyces semiglobifer]